MSRCSRHGSQPSTFPPPPLLPSHGYKLPVLHSSLRFSTSVAPLFIPPTLNTPLSLGHSLPLALEPPGFWTAKPVSANCCCCYGSVPAVGPIHPRRCSAHHLRRRLPPAILHSLCLFVPLSAPSPAFSLARMANDN